MRISRKRRQKKPLIPRYNKNIGIVAPTVRVLDENDENIGVMTLESALALVAEREMDLVEINPKADPPVCKIIDYTTFKYQKEKEARKQKAKSHTSELKGIRLSIRISEHDREVRATQAQKFLNRGDKVKIEILLRGREKMKGNLGREAITEFVTLLSQTTPVRYEQEISYQGGKITAIIVKK